MSRLSEENARLHEKASEIQQQLESRKVVERAKGILQQRYKMTEEEAYLRLRNESRRSRKAYSRARRGRSHHRGTRSRYHFRGGARLVALTLYQPAALPGQ
jgi:ANTAR domain